MRRCSRAGRGPRWMSPAPSAIIAPWSITRCSCGPRMRARQSFTSAPSADTSIPRIRKHRPGGVTHARSYPAAALVRACAVMGREHQTRFGRSRENAKRGKVWPRKAHHQLWQLSVADEALVPGGAEPGAP